MNQKIIILALILSVSIATQEIKDIYQCQNTFCYQERYLAEQTNNWEYSLVVLQNCLADGQEFQSCIDEWESGYPQRKAFGDCLVNKCNFFDYYNSCQQETFALWRCQADNQCLQNKLKNTIAPIFLCNNIKRPLNCSKLSNADWTKCNYQNLIDCTNQILPTYPKDNILSQFYYCQVKQSQYQ